MKFPAIIGTAGIVATLSLNEWLALCVAVATVLSLIPLIFWRWRALLTGRRKEDK